MTFENYRDKFREKLVKSCKIETSKKVYVSEEEKKELVEKGVEVKEVNPEYVKVDGKDFYYEKPLPLSDGQYEQLKQMNSIANIRTMKNCILFFTVLTAVSLALYLITVLIAIS